MKELCSLLIIFLHYKVHTENLTYRLTSYVKTRRETHNIHDLRLGAILCIALSLHICCDTTKV